MFRNYLKTAWRNITKSFGYSLLNIFGLALGMAVALLIGLWVYDQYTYDKFLPQYESVYRVQRNFNSNGDTLTFQSSSLKLANALRTQIPEVEYLAESDWVNNHGLVVGDKKLFAKGAISGADILKIFQYPFVEGNANKVFRDPYSIVVTESLAKSLFGNDDAMNKTVRFDNEHDLKVTGILKDLPDNASFKFSYIVPSSYAYAMNPRLEKDGLSSYGMNNRQIFVKLEANVDYKQVASKIRNIEHTESGSLNAMNSFITFQPITRWHLYSNYVNGKDTSGFLEYVKMFTIIGVLVLIIACINFVNLTTSRSEGRAKEVGVRKAIGSRKRDLVIQFLLEAFVLTLLAFVLAFLIVWIVLPFFNNLTESKIAIPFSNIYFWLVMVILLLLTTILAGGRPALYLSSFNPTKVLKGTLKGGKTSLSRKILVVVQFSCSVALIVSTIVIFQQIQYAKNRPKGYSLDQLMTTHMNDDLSKNYNALKNEMIQKGIVTSVTSASSPATDIEWHSDIDQWPGKTDGETIEMGTIETTENYFQTLNMDFLEGRNFSSGLDSTSVVFNEAAIRKMRIKDPIGKTITWQDDKYTIVGVVKDALMLSPFKSADPTMFLCEPRPNDNIIYRLSPHISTQDAVAQLTNIFNKYSPAFPYNFNFSNEQYDAKFHIEFLIGKLAALFAALAILISCLGLFGLVAYTSEQRTKEIGVRKVLGASVKQVWMLLSKDFIVLVGISCLIAVPISYYFLSHWLQNYDYHVKINVGIFVLSAFVALFITILTVSFQAIKAAKANPVKSLRSE
ncbi:MAG: ABC transporter permease [Pseudopedobacter saltans]|uniref:ABC transporter permease n=1 Tax=Pseudopedobacter saltans TaxID=151895 RepID=A0A2W5ESS9_9SPHI|nr:MAG: ABC transporter permease [Pseudopedobacter saltans]